MYVVLPRLFTKIFSVNKSLSLKQIDLFKIQDFVQLYPRVQYEDDMRYGTSGAPVPPSERSMSRQI